MGATGRVDRGGAFFRRRGDEIAQIRHHLENNTEISESKQFWILFMKRRCSGRESEQIKRPKSRQAPAGWSYRSAEAHIDADS
jgi:hypothetical protein